ncbi:MAG: glycosyltransferase family 4 protein, partial [Acetobacteraceae bacterium]
LADDTARAAAGEIWDGLPRDARPVIDGLALPAFRARSGALAERGAIGLIHHPTALETGQPEQDRAFLRDAERLLMPRLTRVIVTSEPTRTCLAADFGVAGERISVVVPGTDDLPRCIGSGGPACQILSVGTLVPRKGHDVLLRALSSLLDLDWQLTVVGSPERDCGHARMLSALAGALGIASRVKFAGEIDDAALEALWQGSDLFALATHWEGYGMAVAEALKRGLPVAVTAGGATASLVPAGAGTLSPPGDPAPLSAALRRVISRPALRRQMAEAAFEAGKALPSWPAQAQAFAGALAASQAP